MMRLAAKKFAALGLPVFPLFGVVLRGSAGLQCMCGKPNCRSVGKHPNGRLVPSGHKHATTDPATIDRWWAGEEWNVGIAIPPGVLVLDVDPRDGGDRTLAALEAQHEPLPRTWRVATGGDGQHHFFKLPPDITVSAPRLTKGLDLKSSPGGYVVAPPSRHASGRSYTWITNPNEVDLAPVPRWLLDMSLEHREPKAAFSAYYGGEQVVSEGGRNTTLTSIFGHLLGCRVDAILAADLVRSHNAHRCKPPLDDDEVEQMLGSIASRERFRRGGRR